MTAAVVVKEVFLGEDDETDVEDGDGELGLEYRYDSDACEKS